MVGLNLLQTSCLSLSTVQYGISSYALYLSYESIANTLPYEEKTKKAAKFSSTAGERLHGTRSTLAIGVLISVISIIASLGHFIATLWGLNVHVVFSLALLASVVAARMHISNFWRTKAKVPGVDQYNKAITTSNGLKNVLGYSALGWAAASLLAVWPWMS